MLRITVANDSAEEDKYCRVEQTFTDDTKLLTVLEKFIHALSVTGFTRINAEEMVQNIIEGNNK